MGKDYTRLENMHRKVLEDAKNEFANRNKSQVRSTEVDEGFVQIKHIVARPPTPVWTYDEGFNLIEEKDKEGKAFFDEAKRRREVDRRTSAIIFLQRVIRGRTQQNIMYEGKEKRLALIEELLTVAKTQPISEEEAERFLLKEHEEKLRDALIEGLQGEVISETLDYLSKELVRVKQFNRISELIKIAERDRREREIEEAGRREAEEILRNREQILYN